MCCALRLDVGRSLHRSEQFRSNLPKVQALLASHPQVCPARRARPKAGRALDALGPAAAQPLPVIAEGLALRPVVKSPPLRRRVLAPHQRCAGLRWSRCRPSTKKGKWRLWEVESSTEGGRGGR